MTERPRFDYHVYTLTEGVSWYWTPWADGMCKPVHGPYASHQDAMDAVAQDPKFSGWDKVLHRR